MELNEYAGLAAQTATYPNRHRNIEYPALGLAGEAGEVANLVKKIQRDHNGSLTPEMRSKLIDELGDVLWYIAAMCVELQISLDYVAGRNVEKLQKRYSTK